MQSVQRFILVAVLCSAFVALAQCSLINEEVTRSVDVTSALYRETVHVRVKNTGKEAATTYRIRIHGHCVSYLSSVKVGSNYLSASETDGDDSIFIHKLSTALQAGQATEFSIHLVYTNVLEPFPKTIAQSDKQFVRLEDTLHYYSDYETETQKVTYKFATAKFESSPEVEPSRKTDNGFEYGPFENLPAKSLLRGVFHFGFSGPILRASRCVREIEVSHWGNVAVEEQYDVMNAGATLKGLFSRVDYQRSPDVYSGNAIKSIVGVLPKEAKDIYYRDVIGNITTSDLATASSGDIQITIRPRFPLFGGWKTAFHLGYNLPTESFLSTSGDRFQLNIGFGSAFPDFACDSIEVHVILPEGSTDIRSHTPFTIDNKGEDRRYTFLDTVGRPVVVLRKDVASSEHDQKLTVTYTFTALDMTNEPALLVMIILFFHLAVMVYVRLDGTIVRDEKYYKAEAEDDLRFFLDSYVNAAEQEHALLSGLQAQLAAGHDAGRVLDSLRSEHSRFAALHKETDLRKNEIAALREDVGNEAAQLISALKEFRTALEALLNSSTAGSTDAKIAEEQKKLDQASANVDALVKRVSAHSL